MKHLKKLALLLFAILSLQSQVDCTPMNTVTTSECSIAVDNSPANGPITVIGDILRFSSQERGKLKAAWVTDQENNLIYFNIRINILNHDVVFDVNLSDICSGGGIYRAYSVTGRELSMYEFTYQN